MEFEYIFFDLANTLVHKEEVFKQIYDILKENGKGISLEKIIYVHKIVSETIDFPDKTNTEFYKKFNRLFLNALGVVSDKNLGYEIYERCRKLPWQIFEDTKIIKELPIRKGIISNWDKTLKDKLDVFFGDIFTTIIGSADIGIKKPDVEIYKFAIKNIGILPEKILYVGDSLKLDYIPAKEAGMNVWLLDRHNLFPNNCCQKISSLMQIKNILYNDK